MSLRRFPIMRLSALVTLMVLGYTPAAHAYIDPTAAGAALQSMYVIFASALMAVALLPQKVASGFAWLKRKVKGQPDPIAPPTDAEG